MLDYKGRFNNGINVAVAKTVRTVADTYFLKKWPNGWTAIISHELCRQYPQLSNPAHDNPYVSIVTLIVFNLI